MCITIYDYKIIDVISFPNRAGIFSRLFQDEMVARTQSLTEFQNSILIPSFKHYENAYYMQSLIYLITSNSTKFLLISQSITTCSRLLDTWIPRLQRVFCLLCLSFFNLRWRSSISNSLLERYGFGNRFVTWVKVLLKNQESCKISGDNTTKYFKLEKGTRPGDTISVYLFTIVLETVFLSIMENKNMKCLNMLNHTFLYTAYTGDKTIRIFD